MRNYIDSDLCTENRIAPTLVCCTVMCYWMFCCCCCCTSIWLQWNWLELCVPFWFHCESSTWVICLAPTQSSHNERSRQRPSQSELQLIRIQWARKRNICHRGACVLCWVEEILDSFWVWTRCQNEIRKLSLRWFMRCVPTLAVSRFSCEMSETAQRKKTIKYR